MSVMETSGKVDFLFTLKEGPATKSYGVQVARLAGVPDSITDRAEQLLNDIDDKTLLSTKSVRRLKYSEDQLSIFDNMDV